MQKINLKGLKQILDGTNTYNYTYNEQGLRIKKNINGVETKYYLQGTNIIQEEKYGQTIEYIYNEQNQLVGFEHQQNKYFYVRDLLGIIRNIININGNIVVIYKYDAWGNRKVYDSSNSENINASFIGNINPFRYKGYYYDVETEWYYLKSRYYSPILSRFINMDNTQYLEPGNVDGINLFAYCGNNPVMYSDSTGKFPILISLAIIFGIGALSGVAGTFIGDIATSAMTGEWSFTSWETYVGSAIGYGVGTIAMTYLGPTAGLAIGGGLSTFAGMSLEKATGTNNRSWEEIALWTAGSAAFSAVMGQLFKGLRIDGITAGRGSFQHVMRTQFTNMVRHGYDISFKTAAKSFVAMTVSRQLTGGVFTGIRRAAIEWWEYLIYGDKEGIGWA